jgi:predicted chitinase/peptidoglycan hydrolase-like protein with peptidoglycan-binding domain
MNSFRLQEDRAPTSALEGAPETTQIGDDIDTSPDAPDEAIRPGEFTESEDLPAVRWSEDLEQPDYAHSHTAMSADLPLPKTFSINADLVDLLVRANRFQPTGKNDLIAFGIRGARLLGVDMQENATSFEIEDVRPDHSSFNCTLGLFDTQNRLFCAYSGSTVPNRDWMRRYYRKSNLLQGRRGNSNLLPTGCYVYRVNTHGFSHKNPVTPALRLTDPGDLSADGACTVLRTSNDLAYAHDDLWDRCIPFDNIHCAYSDSSFSSAGCQTIKGADGKGPWGAFQRVIGALGTNARVDYMLLTGRDYAIAAAICAAGRQQDAALIETTLGRLRVGSHGESVSALQIQLGFTGRSAYFGPLTREALVAAEKARGLASDGIYAPSDDIATGWEVFGPAGEVVPVAAAPGPVTDQSRSNKASFRSVSGSPRLELDRVVNLRHGGANIPLRIVATVEGLPASEIGVELSLSTFPLAAPPAATKTANEGPFLTSERLDAFASHSDAGYRETLLAEGDAMLAPFGITATPRRLAHFLAQLSHESAGLRLREENLNYTTTERLLQVWPSRFPNADKAVQFVRNPEDLANEVYGGRMGNSAPGDGFRYRGRGLIQLTGRGNYRVYGQHLGIDLENDPDSAADPSIALRIAAEFWSRAKLRGERPMNALADDDKITAITYRINGGFNGAEHRSAELERAKLVWGDSGGTATGTSDRGDFDDRVRSLQLLLIEHRALTGKVDGKFGKNTYDGLFRFKTARRMQDAGYADTETFAALKQPGPPIDTIEGSRNVPVIGVDEPEPVREVVNAPPD